MLALLSRLRGVPSGVPASGLGEAIAASREHCVCLLDAQGRILAPVSQGLARLLRSAAPAGKSLDEALAPLLAPKLLSLFRGRVGMLLTAGNRRARALEELELRAVAADGSRHTAHYVFDFEALTGADGTPLWLLRATEVTAALQMRRDLEELRLQARTQGDILRGVLRMGAVRFAAFMQKADASMKNIEAVLRKPAREADAFRGKLDELLEEVDRVRREAAAFKLAAVESGARLFEDALQELRLRTTLSGSDFLPLTVKLDHLYEQVALVRSLTLAQGAPQDPDSNPVARMTDGGTQIIEAPNFDSLPARRAVQEPGPAGSLDSTLRALTDHVAQTQEKQVVMESRGLELVPAAYQPAVKNVAIQLIRNAVMHGIEMPAERSAAGKAAHGTLRLSFAREGAHYQLFFEDDGCGLVPQKIKETAIARGVVSREAADVLTDREALKLIFKSRYTTLAATPDDLSHGGGMSMVRRYVHDAGGNIALASVAGRDTRFKITLPVTPAVDTHAA